MRSDMVSRSWLLENYDKTHLGPPGAARELIRTAPDAKVQYINGTSGDDTGLRDLAMALSAERIRRGLSQPALADIAGISVNTVGNLERGKTVNTDSLRYICKALGVKLVFNFERKESEV